jgi:uncharacterized alpha/beta hydrolase family protein
MKSIADIDPILTEKRNYFDKLFDVKIKDILVIELSKEDFNKLDQEEWVVGFAFPRKKIVFVLKQEESGRNYQEWLKVIIHEMVHIYYFTKFNSAEPKWFFEGLACYLADQKKKDVDVNIKDLIDKKGDYVKGYNIIRRILENA